MKHYKTIYIEFKYILFLLLFSVNFVGTSQNMQGTDFKYPKLITDFTSENWQKVYKAKDSLLQIGKKAIPDLIKLLENPKNYVKLKNTNSLIYPGASEFWGHGWGINYDLDWISVRAGWAIEDFTLKAFGFDKALLTKKEDLIYLYRNSYDELIKKDNSENEFQKNKLEYLQSIILDAKKWWSENKYDWTILKGLKDAIYSNNIDRQFNAIQQMRFPKFTIYGLDQEWFETNIKQRIKELNKSDDQQLVVQTNYLLRDGVRNKKW